LIHLSIFLFNCKSPSGQYPTGIDPFRYGSDYAFYMTNNENLSSPFILLRDISRYGAIGVAITLIGYLVYRKTKQRKLKREAK